MGGHGVLACAELLVRLVSTLYRVPVQSIIKTASLIAITTAEMALTQIGFWCRQSNIETSKCHEFYFNPMQMEFIAMLSRVSQNWLYSCTKLIKTFMLCVSSSIRSTLKYQYGSFLRIPNKLSRPESL
jgi:hypothetical protein